MALGGEVTEGRGRKGKKTRWQVVLGLKQILCGALGIAWMMVIIFILGVLAGRGDIYRWLSNWGLVSSEAPKIVQWSPPPEAPPVASPAKSSPVAAPPAAAPTAVPPSPSTSASPPPPVTGSLTGTPPSSSPPGKKARRGSSRDQKAKEEELRRLRQEVAPKLKFQNSFDTTPTKPGRTAQKHKEKEKPGTAAAKSPPKQVRLAQYRDLKAAKAKMAEFEKNGEKVTLKQGKDQHGTYYEIFRQTPANTREAEGLAQKTQKPGGKKTKSQAETGN